MRRDDARLLDILLAARKILAFTEGISFDRFAGDEAIQSAVSYQLVIIGEAARFLGDETKSGLPDIPWQQVVGLRNLLAHEYFRVDVRRVWNIVRADVPSLIRQIEPLVPPDRSDA